MYKDICFCDNKNCKKRKTCARALENHNKDNITKFISIAYFECFTNKKHNYYIKKN